MTAPRITIDGLPNKATPETDDILIIQDSGVTKRTPISGLLTLPPTPLTDHLNDAVDAHDASAISAISSGLGVDSTTAQGQLTQLGTLSRASVLEAVAYGVVPDGVTDCTSALQTAVTAACAASKPLRLPPGTILITAEITHTGSLTLIGAGPFRTRIRNNSLTANYFTASNVSFVTMTGIEFDSTVIRTGGILFNYSNVDHVRLNNVRIIDPYKCGDFVNCDLIQMTDVYMVHGGRGFNRGFFFQTCVATIIDKMISNMGVQTVANPQLLFDSGCDTIAISNTVIACQAGAGGQAEAIAYTHSLSPASFAPRWARLSNVYCESGTTKPGMRVDAVTSLYVTNGYFVSSLRGVDVAAGVDLRFATSLFAGNQEQGLRLAATGATNIASFISSSFSDNSQVTTNTHDGALINAISGSASFINCYFGDEVLNRANKQRYGINIGAPVALIRPTFHGNATANIGGASGPVEGFYGGTAVAKQTGVAVTAAAIHAALVNLGLIAP